MTRKGHYATTPGALCNGGCGKHLRPSRAPKEQYPGTVRDYGHGFCGVCRANQGKPKAQQKQAKARDDSFRPYCVECGIALRRQGVSKEDEPDTVKHRGRGMCFRCFDAPATDRTQDEEFDAEQARRDLESWIDERRARIRVRVTYPVGDVQVQYNPLNDVAVVTRQGNPLGAAYGLPAGFQMAHRHAAPARTMADMIPGL